MVMDSCKFLLQVSILDVLFRCLEKVKNILPNGGLIVMNPMVQSKKSPYINKSKKGTLDKKKIPWILFLVKQINLAVF